MKKYLVLSINVIVLVGLILYSVVVSNQLSNLKYKYESAYNEFAKLDKKYFSKLENINIEIEKNLNEPEFRKFPDSIRLKLINQRRLGSYFYDYKVNTDWTFALLKTGLQKQLIAIRVLTIIGVLSFLLNAFYIFFRERRNYL